jgi:TetR/AcrR family transcriptional repressor of bet genes
MARADIKDVRPKQLIDATIAMIAKHGFARTTLALVAKHAELSPGIVGFYFKSKDALFLATLKFLADEYERKWMAAVEGLGPAEALEAMIEIDFHPDIANRRKIAVWAAFWAESVSRPEYARLVAQLEKSYFEVTREICSAMIERSGRTDLDADLTALGLNALVDGLWLDLLFDPPSFDRETAKRTCRAWLGSVFGEAYPRTTVPAALKARHGGRKG